MDQLTINRALLGNFGLRTNFKVQFFCNIANLYIQFEQSDNRLKFAQTVNIMVIRKFR